MNPLVLEELNPNLSQDLLLYLKYLYCATPTSNKEPMRNNASQTQALRGQGSFLD